MLVVLAFFFIYLEIIVVNSKVGPSAFIEDLVEEVFVLFYEGDDFEGLESLVTEFTIFSVFTSTGGVDELTRVELEIMGVRAIITFLATPCFEKFTKLL